MKAFQLTLRQPPAGLADLIEQTHSAEPDIAVLYSSLTDNDRPRLIAMCKQLITQPGLLTTLKFLCVENLQCAKVAARIAELYTILDYPQTIKAKWDAQVRILRKVERYWQQLTHFLEQVVRAQAPDTLTRLSIVELILELLENKYAADVSQSAYSNLYKIFARLAGCNDRVELYNAAKAVLVRLPLAEESKAIVDLLERTSEEITKGFFAMQLRRIPLPRLEVLYSTDF